MFSGAVMRAKCWLGFHGCGPGSPNGDRFGTPHAGPSPRPPGGCWGPGGDGSSPGQTAYVSGTNSIKRTWIPSHRWVPGRRSPDTRICPLGRSLPSIFVGFQSKKEKSVCHPSWLTYNIHPVVLAGCMRSPCHVFLIRHMSKSNHRNIISSGSNRFRFSTFPFSFV